MKVLNLLRLVGIFLLGGGVALILTLVAFYILFGIFLIALGYSMTGLSIWSLVFKSRRDKSISETRGPGDEQDGRKSLPEVAMEPKRFWPGDRDETREEND